MAKPTVKPDAAIRSDAWIKQIGKNRDAPRIYLDGLQAIRSGFAAGDRYNLVIEGDRLVLTANKDGSRVVSKKKRGESEFPVIDINSEKILSVFKGMTAVRVVVRDDKIFILPVASEARKKERLERITRKIMNNEPMEMGSLSHGGGILSHAIHAGLKDAGIETNLAFANEIREDLLEQAALHNDSWSKDTQILNLPMQELAQDEWLLKQLPKLDILEMGLPCSGASRAGKSKRGLEMMEDHPDVGHLVYGALVILDRTQPSYVLLENVTEYATSASAQILRHQLRDMGYTTCEAILSGKDFGSLENRVRWCMVAHTKGTTFSFDDIQPKVKVVRMLGEVLESIPLDDPSWREVSYLKDKEIRVPASKEKHTVIGGQIVDDILDKTIAPNDPCWRSYSYLFRKSVRDKAKGSGFGMQFVSPSDDQVPTLRKGYHKGGSTDPLLRHPTNPELFRQFTAAEHARIKQVPDHLIVGLSNTIAHESLGQGIVYAPFKDVGRRIGQALSELADKVESHECVEEEPQRAMGVCG